MLNSIANDSNLKTSQSGSNDDVESEAWDLISLWESDPTNSTTVDAVSQFLGRFAPTTAIEEARRAWDNLPDSNDSFYRTAGALLDLLIAYSYIDPEAAGTLLDWEYVDEHGNIRDCDDYGYEEGDSGW